MKLLPFKTKTAFLLLPLFCTFLPLFSCASRIGGSLTISGGAALDVTVSLEPTASVLMKKPLAAFGGQDASVLDGSAITRSIINAPGVSAASLRNTSPEAVEGQVRISKINDFLAAADGRCFINFEQSGTGGRCIININRDNGPVIIELLSSQITDLMNALIAPLVTGDEISKAEYLELVALFYKSKALSDEIAGSRIRASIDFPGQVTSVKGGTFSGKRAEFDIPLLDILVLETPLLYEVVWK